MFQETYFTFDGVSSETFGVALCQTGDGQLERQFGLNKSIVSETVPGNPIPYSFEDKTEVLSGDINLWFCDDFDDSKLAEISMWLYQDNFKPFISNDRPDVVYYIKFINKHQLTFSGNQGYITVSFVCDAPWGWTNIFSHSYDLRTLSEITFTIDNVNNYSKYDNLEFKIQIPDDSSSPGEDSNIFQYTVLNVRNTLEKDKFILDNVYITLPDGTKKELPAYHLQKGETITINMSLHSVTSDNSMFPSRLNNCNKKWVTLLHGKNKIEFHGKCILTVNLQTPYLV